jgi:hypothetical protein
VTQQREVQDSLSHLSRSSSKTYQNAYRFSFSLLSFKCHSGIDPNQLFAYEDKEKEVCIRFVIKCEDMGGCPDGMSHNGLSYSFGAYKRSDIPKFELGSLVTYQDIYVCKFFVVTC